MKVRDCWFSVVPFLKARIGLCHSDICTLEISLDDVGYPGGHDLVVLGQLVHVDHLVRRLEIEYRNRVEKIELE